MGGETKRNNNLIESIELARRQSRTSGPDLKIWIANQVSGLAVAFGCEITGERLESYAEHLADISKEKLQRAFWQAGRDLKFFPKIAELRELAGVLPGSPDDGRPGPEEAWARMPKGERMEEDSVVWCKEERAAYAACRSLLVDGDLIGARMAFKERYEKEVAEARAQGKPIQWIVSQGFDVEHRLTTLATAVQEKRMSLESALNFVPGERQNEFAQMLPSADTKALLTGKVEKMPNLPGLTGVLAKMRMEGTVPEELQASARPPHRTPSERSEDEVRVLREKAKAQIEFVKRSRNGAVSGDDQAGKPSM
jgi:hypothetical protein